MWAWEIVSGMMYDLTLSGAFTAAKGYSGFDFYKNNPASCTVHHMGPLPPGVYNIEPSYTHPELGPLCFNLEPVAGDMFGRSEFRIHGDNPGHPGMSSHGCIVLPKEKREMLDQSTDRLLIVIAVMP